MPSARPGSTLVSVAQSNASVGGASVQVRVNAARRMRELRYGNNTASVIVTITHPEGTTGRPRLRVVKRCEHTEFCAGLPKAG